MKRIIRILVVLVAVVIATGGCAQYAWYKNGATTQDFNQDKYRCAQESTRSGYSSQPVYNFYTGQYLGQSASGGAYVDQGMYNACMQAAGWSLVRRDSNR